MNHGHPGLTSAEAEARLARCGPNVLPSEAPPGVLEIALRQLKSPLMYVLLAAAVVALALGDFTDAGFIGVVLLLNACIGGWQEWRAEQQSRALQQMLRVRATVLRDGRAREIDAEQLVPGDVVALESGQRVPADLRMLVGHGLEIEESLLTGESLPVAKDAHWSGPPDTPLGHRRNMAFAGTTVTRGRGRGEVVATGSATVIGGLALTMSATLRGKPPLVERMERFSRVIAVAILAAALVVGAVGVLVHGQGVGQMFMTAVALAVSAIPEGLPVALTIVLAIAARRMAGRGAIVRRLPAVEGLGSCTLIASDKTGTLTCNELTVRELWLPDGSALETTGAGYQPDGEIRPKPPGQAPDPPSLQALLEIAAACNEADLSGHDGRWTWRGDPTDVALLALARKGGVDRDRLLSEWPQVGEIPFEPERRYSASFHERDGGSWVAVKGAPECVLQMCRMPEAELAAARRAAEDLASRGYRVLALAAASRPGRVTPEDGPGGPSELTLHGLLGLIDPLRSAAREAVERCREAGIRVVMVTGDHPLTALAIARELGIVEDASQVHSGPELEAATPDQLKAMLDGAAVLARVTPEQKLAFVAAAQASGHYVAVTGDGVNDAPALRRGNIGVAMGRGGTDVAREASGLVLSDDNFATIVSGVQEGRIAYQNVRNVIYLLVAAGLAEVLTVGLAVVVGLPLPLLPAQLLWLNVVTNGIQHVGLAFEGGHGDELREPPRRPGEPVFNRLMIERVLLAGTWMAAVAFTAFVVLVRGGVPVEDARNGLLLLMVLMQNVDAFNARSEKRSVLRIPLATNPVLVAGVSGALLLHVAAMHLPFLQRVLGIAPLTGQQWLVLPALALTLLAAMELQKLSWRWRRRKSP